ALWRVPPQAGATVTLATTAASCGNPTGSITATVTGGVAPFQYSIDGGANYQNGNEFDNLAANPYTITVKDANGCISTASTTVTSSAGATVTLATTAASCGNPTGSITATVTGGVAPFQYSIDGGANYQNSNEFDNLAANPYTITVKDAN